VEKPEGKNHCGDPGVDGKITLKRLYRNGDVGAWTGLSRLRIQTGGGPL
jgi:hypothetical protein